MKKLSGIAAAPGLAFGPATIIRPATAIDLTAKHTGDSESEQSRLTTAIEHAIVQMDTLQHAANKQTAEILAAQREMLDDPELKEGAEAQIAAGLTAEAAITTIAEEYAVQLAQIDDPYLAARAEDVREAGRRIVAQLRGSSFEIHLTQPTVLVAQDLSPAETVGLDINLLQAIVTEHGSATGHLAIVAQGLGIPAVVGTPEALRAITEGSVVIVDGNTGTVIVAPDEQALAEAESSIKQAQQARQEQELYREQRGLTADGVHIEVFANIASQAEAQKAVTMGAEGVGLFRTELLATRGLPTEEAQYAIYREVAATLQRPLIIRTFDIGGDKPVPGLNIPSEDNPFLGWRGIRLGLDRPQEVFLPQIRAILRAAADYDLRIMLPMIADPDEVAEARVLIDSALEDLLSEGHTARRVPIGIMVETPAAALAIDQYVGLIDFASIGTNDLTQYTYAVDRTNAQVQKRAQPLGTALLRLIALTCKAEIPVAVCGQLASNEQAIPILVGLGVRELSVAPARIPEVKRTLATLTLSEMQALAQAAIKTR
ncbi:phosphoenolpyruvate--protein phosphotransferase [Ktedonobacteria bacterium brp13]|nr:phosphoenolpyruvate--protein phosphotransferase [Ktedonobacteria bacterium brp13]